VILELIITHFEIQSLCLLPSHELFVYSLGFRQVWVLLLSILCVAFLVVAFLRYILVCPFLAVLLQSVKLIQHCGVAFSSFVDDFKHLTTVCGLGRLFVTTCGHITFENSTDSFLIGFF
jgi:hypothetical protein